VKGDAVMSPGIHEALNDFLLDSTTENIHLRYAGGEPLLVFDIWDPYARALLEHDKVTVEVLTNLQEVPEKFWDFAAMDNVNISVSLDGAGAKPLTKSINDKLKRLRNPWIMTTITEDNVEDLDVLATFIGMNNYGWCLTTDYFGKTEPDWRILAGAVMSIIDTLRQFDYDFKRISFNNFSMGSNFSACRAGDEMFAVGCNGDIFSCQTLIGSSSKIGDVFSGYQRKRIRQRSACQECSLYGLCSGWCPIHYKIPNPICNVIKLFAHEIIKEVKKYA
jgi:radical SAM protein with 4Fe4S-binding SPASM domain